MKFQFCFFIFIISCTLNGCTKRHAAPIIIDTGFNLSFDESGKHYSTNSPENFTLSITDAYNDGHCRTKGHGTPYWIRNYKFIIKVSTTDSMELEVATIGYTGVIKDNQFLVDCFSGKSPRQNLFTTLYKGNNTEGANFILYDNSGSTNHFNVLQSEIKSEDGKQIFYLKASFDATYLNGNNSNKLSNGLLELHFAI